MQCKTRQNAGKAGQCKLMKYNASNAMQVTTRLDKARPRCNACNRLYAVNMRNIRCSFHRDRLIYESDRVD